MAYTPPAYNAANFQQNGNIYASPAYNAADFNFGWLLKTGGRALLNITARSLAPVTFSISGAGVASWKNSNIVLDIQAGGSALFQNSAVAFVGMAGAIPDFQSGATKSASFSGAGVASTDIQRYYALNMRGSSTVNMVGEYKVPMNLLQIRGTSLFSAKGNYHAQTRMVSFGKATAVIPPRALVGTNISSLSESVFSADIAGYKDADFLGEGQGNVTYCGQAVSPREISAISNGIAQFNGQVARPSVASIYGGSALGFASSYATAAIPSPSMFAPVFVISRERVVMVKSYGI